MRPVLPLDWFGLAHQPNICLVDERRGLQGLVRPAAPQITPGQRMELAIDMRRKLFERGGIAVAPLHQQLGDRRSLFHEDIFCHTAGFSGNYRDIRAFFVQNRLPPRATKKSTVLFCTSLAVLSLVCEGVE